MKVFFSYAFDREEIANELFVHRVSYYLGKQRGVEVFCYTEEEKGEDWRRRVGPQVRFCDCLVFFQGRRRGKTQEFEIEEFLRRLGQEAAIATRVVAVELPNGWPLDGDLFPFARPAAISVTECGNPGDELWESSAEGCAKRVFGALFRDGRAADEWIPRDGLPTGYPFDYEKDIISAYVNEVAPASAAGENGFLLTPRRLQQGCPARWPTVDRVGDGSWEYDSLVPTDKTGGHRPVEASIAVDARTEANGGAEGARASKLTFLEAGPRRRLRLPSPHRGVLRIGIVVSGGIAPGINAVIAGIVERHQLYHRWESLRRRGPDAETARGGEPLWEPRYNLEFVLYEDGFAGLRENRTRVFAAEGVREWTDRGGSMVGTSRSDDMLDVNDLLERERALDDIAAKLGDHPNRIDILYVIGGEGSMRAAHAIWSKVRAAQGTTSVVGIPKTMDNDILWVWQSFGFLSAVQQARETILQLQTEVMSNPRFCILQLFGSDSGFVVSHAVLASGSDVCDVALIPEVPFSMRGLSEYLRDRLWRAWQHRVARNESPHGMIVMAETAIPRDVEDYIDNPLYPELSLEEKEREEILSFVDSSLLRSSDIADENVADEKGAAEGWLRLCETLRRGMTQDEGPLHRVWSALSPEVQGIVWRASEKLGHDDALKTRIVKALNELLREPGSLAAEVDALLDLEKIEQSDLPVRGDLAPERRQVLLESSRRRYEKLELVKTMQPIARRIVELSDDPGEELRRKLIGASGLPVSHEARRLIQRFPESGRPDSDVEPMARVDWARLGRRLVESVNRAILEIIVPEIREKTRTPRSARRVHGQTPDKLRTGGLKVVSGVLQEDIRRELGRGEPYWSRFRVFTNEPRHLLRAIPPSSSDVIFGKRLGALAVDNAMAGFTDFMVSQWLTEYVLVPLELVTLGRKRVPEKGIFWRSVVSNTGQPPRM